MRNKIIAICLKSIPFWIVVLLVLQIVISNQLVNHSRKIEELDSKRHAMLEENEMLNQQLTSVTSLQSVEKQAKLLGFIQAASVISMEPGSYRVALQTAK